MIPASRHKTTLLLFVTATLSCIVLLAGTAPKGATAVSPSNNPPEGWVVECVDCLHYFTGMSGSSAALDSDGFVHTAYGGDGLYYATQNPDDTFQIEVVDDNPYRGVNATMVLDSSDRPHILYYAADLLRLNYAHFDGSQWQIETLPTAALTMPPNPWLVIDSNGFLHVVYNENGVDVVYGRYDFNTWDFTIVDTADTVPIGRPSIALDSDDLPHIAYASGQKYAYFDGFDWQITTFTDPFTYGGHAAIALDQNDSPHIALQADVDTYWGYDVVHRYRDSEGWQWVFIEEMKPWKKNDHLGDAISIAIDAANQSVVTYSGLFYDFPYPFFYYYDLHYAYSDSSSGSPKWEVKDLSTTWPLYDMNYSTVLPGTDNTVTIVFKDGPDLKLAVLEDGTPTTTVIDAGGSTGTYNDMAVDNEDRLHISTREAEKDELRYGVKENGVWAVEKVGDGVGRFSDDWTAIAVSATGRPYIIFEVYDRFINWRIAFYHDPNWIIDRYEFNDGKTYNGVVNQDDILQLAFFNESRIGYDYGLAHMSVDPDHNWSEITNIDPTMIEGQLDITLDSADFPHIVYPVDGGLGYAVQTPNGWITTTVTGGSVDYPSLALDKDNYPYIAWYDKNVQDLKYATFDGDDWHFAAVDTEGDVGRYADLAVDNLGRVYIAYYDATNQDLKYATFDGAAWTTTTLISEGDVGSYSSLVMPYAGYPAIAYYDAVTRDLMMVYRPFHPTNFAYLPLLPAK